MLTEQNTAPNFSDFHVSWRCRYGHVNRLSIGRGYFLGSGWERCSQCSERTSPVDRMKMQIAIINRWLEAGLIGREQFRHMANWTMTSEERERDYCRRSRQPTSETQRLATMLLRSLSRAVGELEALEDRTPPGDEGPPWAEARKEAEDLRFHCMVLVARRGLDTDVYRYTE